MEKIFISRLGQMRVSNFYAKFLVFLLSAFLFSQETRSQIWKEIDMNFPANNYLLSNTSITFATKHTGWILTSGTVDTSLPPDHYVTKIFNTTDGGSNWALQYEDSTYGAGSMFTVDSLHCWAGRLLTTDGGLNWDTISSPGPGSKFYFNYTSGIALTEQRPWFTSNGGRSWNAGESSYVKLYALDIYFVDNKKGWIASDITPFASDAGYIAHTTNGGNTWFYQDSITHKMLAIDFIDSLHGFAVGTNGGYSTGFVYATTNSGKNWSHDQFIGLGSFNDVGFLNNQYGWIVGENKILRTIDGGKTWQIQKDNFQSLLRTLIVLKKDKVAYAFGGIDFNQPPFTLMFADLSELLTQVHLEGGLITDNFQLLQNYPNPFNPSTKIKYSIPNSGYVTLKVFNLLGQEVAALVNKEQNAGEYATEFNASNLASGIYFYRIQSGNYSLTRKMILLK